MFIDIWRGQHTYMATPGALKKKCRQYFADYLKYGFIQSLTNPQPMYLVCEKNFSNEAMKLFRLLEYLQKIHPDKTGKTLAFFQSLRDQFLKRKTMNKFTSSLKNSDDGLKASYNISLLIAKTGKSHTIWEELILPAVKEVIKTVLHKSPEQVIKSIPLSDNSVQRRVDKMAENIEETLSKMLMTTEFSLQLDEFTLPGNESLLLAYVRLLAKNLSEKLHESLLTVITAVNKIKANVLNSQLFHQLCIENDEDFQCLLLHTEVRWLSKGNCLKKFYTLFNSVLDFFQESNPELYDKLKSSKTDIAYLTEMFSKFNEVNLAELHRDMSVRFNNLFSLEIPGCVIDLFTERSTEVPTLLEEELVSLQNDEDLKPKFKTSYQAFWMQAAIPKRYPTLWKDIKLFFIAFLTSYLVERGFRAVSRLLTKQKNKLNITERGDLSLLPTNLHHDVDSLIAMHQAHPSH